MFYGNSGPYCARFGEPFSCRTASSWIVEAEIHLPDPLRRAVVILADELEGSVSHRRREQSRRGGIATQAQRGGHKQLIDEPGPGDAGVETRPAFTQDPSDLLSGQIPHRRGQTHLPVRGGRNDL